MKKNIINWLSLSLIQAANAITPLIIFPFALATVGTEAYAALATTEAAAIAISALVLYSFEIDGPAKVARLFKSTSSQTISDVFSQIFFARLTIFLISAIISIPIVWSVFEERTAGLFTLWLGVPLSYALQSNWVFQVIEKNAGLATIALISRLVGLALVLAYVTDVTKVMLIPAAISACNVFGGIASIVYLNKVMEVKIRSVKINQIWSQLVEGRYIFLGNFSVALYREFNVLIMGAVGATASAIANYSLAEKLIKGIQAVMRPLNQLFFPKALRLLSEKSKPDIDSLKILWKLLYPQLLALILLLLVASVVWLFIIPTDVRLVKLPEHHNVAILIILMIPAVFFGVANFMLGLTGLNFMGYQKYMMKSIVFTGFISIVFCGALAAEFGDIGAGAIFVMAEGVLLLLVMGRYLFKI
jgi:O-antigen/teichoic acid export membrane protein